MTMMSRLLFPQLISTSALFLAVCGVACAQGAAGAQYGPYWQPPVVKGGPVHRLPDGKPDVEGYWAPRFNQAVFNIETHPAARPGLPPVKGAIVDPPDGKIPYKP